MKLKKSISLLLVFALMMTGFTMTAFGVEDTQIELPKVESLEPVTKTVDVDTAKEEIGLPATVIATLEDSSTREVAVSWDCETYDAEIPQDYTFIGTITATDVDPNGQTATATVTVAPVEITGVTAIDPLYVPVGATNAQILALLPETVEVTLENSNTVNSPVSWTIPDNAAETAGTVHLEGTLTTGVKYTNESAIKGEIAVCVTAGAETQTSGTVVTQVPAVVIAYEEQASKEEAIAKLPEIVTVTAGDDSFGAFVSWDCENYNPAKAGTYTFVGTVTAPENVTLTPNQMEATVTISGALVKEVVQLVQPLAKQTTTVSASVKLMTLFPEEVAVVYQDGTTGNEPIVWDETSQNKKASVVGDYTLSGTVGTNLFPITARATVTKAPETTAKIYINDKKINDTTQNIYSGQTYSLKTSITVTWTSTNKNIAYVHNGKLVAKTTGLATITATGSNGETGSFKVRVANTSIGLGGGGSSTEEEEEETPNKEEENKPVTPPAETKKTFQDLGNHAWAKSMIVELNEKGILSGRSETEFAPADVVTRAEFASMLIRAMGLAGKTSDKTFGDVTRDAWYYQAVQTASAWGIISGYEDGTFHPNSSITRQEMAVMSLRAAQAAGLKLPDTGAKNFDDQAQIAGYAADAVAQLTSAQIINGMGDGTFAPTATANRAQAAVIIYQLYDL